MTLVAEEKAALLDIRETARICGFSEKHVRRLSSIGRMPASIKLGRIVRWSRRELLNWIAEGCPDHRQEATPHRTVRAKEARQ